MRNRDYRDIIGGAALIAVGIGAAFYALTSLNFGTLRTMGPGMFPAALGVLLTIFGAVILIQALLREGELPRFEVRPFVAVVASMAVFAILVEPFGTVPAIIAQTLVGSQADGELRIVPLLILAVGSAVGASLIFEIGLGLQLNAFAWPW